ncbi:conserved hypothetical protein [Culex quinquefasciatus]|uniref:DUF7869 domain-containing protein n=1 Tax=Culex quinquefasciatus TaxID=7176 RepID=B0XG25_CULQU|nr:conserved hypothetical protein [Culex quinquefasciatus]|eukprot:XP_001868597.1 conserved hypothetical protein [Culex quinquefasciatus]
MQVCKKITTSTDCNDSDGSFTNEPVLKKRKLTKKERMKRSVAKGRRNTHRAKLTMCRCHRNCNDHVSHDEVKAVNHAFWILDLEGQKNWIRQQVTRREISRRSTNWFENDLRKNTSFLFHLPTSNGTQVEVCRKKFLNAIGYGEDCGNMVYRCFTEGEDGLPVPSRRGKHKRTTPKRDAVRAHILSYNPTISHYRRKHAPKRLYLPSDLTERAMYNDFVASSDAVSYALYCSVFKDLNISLVKLGHEQCEACVGFEQHDRQTGHGNPPVDQPNCSICQVQLEHLKQSRTSRDEYRKDGEMLKKGVVVYSVDLQKVIQLPRLEGLKTVVFSQRLVAYNETFAPVGSYAETQPVLPCLWTEATAGRASENILSTFIKFLKHHKTVREITLWMDNCSAQNKNWNLFGFLILFLNSAETDTKTLNIKYFESGHTFMAADSFHAAVEKQMKSSPPLTYPDFEEVVHRSKRNVEVLSMGVEDFIELDFNISQYTLNQLKPRPYIDNIRLVQLTKGSLSFRYSDHVDACAEDLISCELFSKKQRKTITAPAYTLEKAFRRQQNPVGISSERKDTLINTISPLIEESKLIYWTSLATKQT